jgi:hypothetical protein
MQVSSEQDIHRIHDGTLEILEAKRGDLSGQLVEECLGLLPDRNQLAFDYAPLAVTEPMGLKKGESHIGLIGNAFYIHDI